MGRQVIYWVVTGLLALSAVFAGINYLWGVSRWSKRSRKWDIRSS
jgi:hypothetical protein